MTVINEYNKKPVLSNRLRQFIDNYEDGSVPDDIRLELEQYLKDNEPFLQRDIEQLNIFLNGVLK